MVVLGWIVGILIFLLVLTVSVSVHEAGHMVVAKKFGLHVPRYFVGFGPTLWSTKKGRTEYGVKAIPMGGFVNIEDESQPEGSFERGMLSYVTPWKRILVFLAGPFTNLVMGVVFLLIVLMAWPTQYVTSNISTVNSCAVATAENSSCAAAKAGILAGDKIVSVDGVKIQDKDVISELIAGKTNVDLVINRHGELIEKNIALDDGRLGITMEIGERNIGLGEAFGNIGSFFVQNLEAIAKIPSNVPAIAKNIVDKPETVSQDTPSSIVAVGKAYGDVTSDTKITGTDKVRDILAYSGIINIGLGLFNLLFIPPLDGGHILISLIDSLRMGFSKITRKMYKPLGTNAIVSMTAVAGAMVLAFMVLVITNDVVNIVRGQI